MTEDAPFGDPEPDESFGHYLQRARRFRNRTQRQLAEDLDIDFTYLSKIENDRGDAMSEDRIRRAAHALELDANTLLALAGKVPAEIRQMAQEDRQFATFLRQFPTLPDEARQDIYERARRSS